MNSSARPDADLGEGECEEQLSKAGTQQKYTEQRCGDEDRRLW